LKILHILATPRAEGTPNLVLDWLATGKHEQEVFVLHSEPADLTEPLREGGKWYAEEDYFARGRRKFTDIARGIYRVCRERTPDLVICWAPGFSNWICLGTRLAGVTRLLVHCGNPPARGFLRDWISRSVQWPVRILGGRVICCSAYVLNGIAAVPFVPVKNLYLVHNGANLDRFSTDRTVEAERLSVIMVANLESARDHETLIRAAVVVAKELPGFHLRLVGRGTKMEALTRMITELGLNGIVELTGPRNDVPELLHRSSLFVFSTLEEGFGTALVEALAAGLPIVATDVPACREVLDGGRLGRLVPCRDVAAMAEAIIEQLKKPSTKEDRIERRNHASRFGTERMMNEYLQIAGYSV
jgi:glycosyltransferase involved in cell wall biosynthesis